MSGRRVTRSKTETNARESKLYAGRTDWGSIVSTLLSRNEGPITLLTLRVAIEVVRRERMEALTSKDGNG